MVIPAIWSKFAAKTQMRYEIIPFKLIFFKFFQCNSKRARPIVLTYKSVLPASLRIQKVIQTREIGQILQSQTKPVSKRFHAFIIPNHLIGAVLKHFFLLLSIWKSPNIYEIVISMSQNHFHTFRGSVVVLCT